MAHLLSAEHVGLEYPNQTVLADVSCGLSDGDRVGVVGRNGDGKSSLMALLVAAISPTSGTVRHRRGLSVGYLRQEDDLPVDDSTVEQVIFPGLERYVWASQAKARSIIDGLLGDLDLDGAISALSGGERRRVALARLLVGDWEVIALDEPTNHLDLSAVAWLAKHLKERWPAGRGALVLVTHDRWFLDEVALTTWEVHDGRVEPFDGGYAAYVLARVERDRQLVVAQTKRRNLLRKELAWLGRGAPARTSKPKFHIEAATALIEDLPAPRDPVALHQLAVARLGKQVVDLENASFRYGDQEPWVLTDVNWALAPGERSGLLGLNGAGKSTLLGLISGELTASRGRVKRGKTVKIGLLDQSSTSLDPFTEDLVRQVVSSLKTVFVIDGGQVSAAVMLERLGFSTDLMSTRVGELSGGQRRRLQLLLVLAQEPNVLILDEPTNDVDTDTLTALEDLLDSWPGCLIVVSHDRYFLERVTDQQFAIWEAHLRHLPGGVDQWIDLLGTAPTQASRNESKAGTTVSSNHSGADSMALSAAEIRDLRKQLSRTESRIKRIEEQIERQTGATAQVDASDWQELGRMTDVIEELRLERDQLEEQWLELADRLDAG
ncbi:MAG: ABC-F family ATP-binding cassette domain-containing protein [Propionibacteriaceae bacterium]|nr:ABC-F family ATP-binding cassette domain-containing protein [Propionibacteriaceae bacterium]